MKPIRIFRHIDCEGPAHFQTLLARQKRPFELIKIDEGQQVNMDLSTTAGLIFMGGSMSVNDSYPWLQQEMDLIRQAVAEDIPVLGICLGSQLIAKALGSNVYSAGPCMELGWAAVQCVAESAWTKPFPKQIMVFHWHGETFDLPEGASLLFSNDHTAQQGFCLGPHLALQFHVEMKSETIMEWLDRYPDDIERRCAIQHDVNDIRQQTKLYIDDLQNYAAHLFHHWLSNCKS